MSIKKSAVKKVRQDKKKRLFNKARKEAFKTKIKEVKRSLEAKNTEKAKESLVEAISALDKAAKKHTIHKNTATRKKSRLMKLLNKASGKTVDLKTRKKEASKDFPKKTQSKSKTTKVKKTVSKKTKEKN